MRFKKIVIILLFVVSFMPIYLRAQTNNTGFVRANIWYSKDDLQEGDKVKIYTFIFNPDSRELSGTVVFFNKTTLLGRRNFIIPAKGAEDVSIDWTVTAGDHTIFGKIENSKFLISKGKYEEVYLPENETEKSTISISKKINLKNNANENNSESSLPSVSDIKNVIEEKTPDFISEPVNSATNFLEKFRQENITSSLNKNKEIKKEIYNLDKKNNSTKQSPLLKPFKYVESFIFTVLSMILENKILFYGLLIIFVFIILRFFWRMIF